MRSRNPRGPVARLIMFVAAVGLFVIGYYWGNQYQFSGNPPVIRGVLLRPPVELPGFELKDGGGLPFTLDAFQERWTLLGFGNLREASGHLAVNRMIGVHNRLADQPELQAELQLGLASESQALDLARDFSRLSPALKVLSGNSAEIQRLRAAIGDQYADTTTPGADSGVPLYLIDPVARLMALFPAAQAPETIAADLSALAARPDLLAPLPNE